MTDEQLEELYWQSQQEKENITAQIKAIRVELGERVKKTKQTSRQFGRSIATRFVRVYSRGVSLDVARQYAAVKETVDTSIITRLWKAGNKIPGVVEKWEVKITKIKEDK